MAYDIQLAHRVRTYLAEFPGLKVDEKEMFRGLAFIINGKMCINVSGDNLMCRFDPDLTHDIAKRKVFLREGSFNRKIANEVIKIAPANLELEILEIGQLVHYSEEFSHKFKPLLEPII
ncbi:MAG TPA: TfoX/Sxy family protein [Flavipsychrobacter sp.]|nr:TfoX/Sxy family protein [Flavipsychrobacter sp.]